MAPIAAIDFGNQQGGRLAFAMFEGGGARAKASKFKSPASQAGLGKLPVGYPGH